MNTPSPYEVENEYESAQEHGELAGGSEDVVHIYKVSGPLDQQGWRSTMPPRTSVSSNDRVSLPTAFQLPAAPRPSRTSQQELPYQMLFPSGDKDLYQLRSQDIPMVPLTSSGLIPKVLSPNGPLEIETENHYSNAEELLYHTVNGNG